MNQEIKTKWVAALRSGEYEQTEGALKDHCGFCCLGVLCEISEKETGFGIEETYAENDGREALGLTVRVWAGLPDSSGATVQINGESDFLTKHNDDGRTFLEIADAIEAQL